MRPVLTRAIVTHLEKVTDPRIARGRRHQLVDILFIALSAVIAGANTWADVERYGWAKRDFLKTLLDLPNDIPSHDTFGRVFARLDPAALMACLHGWLTALAGAAAGEVVAIDGKTLCGSFDRASGQAALHLVSAWATANRVVLGQVAVEADSNEITAIPKLLDLLDVAGATVTLDAMGCQKEIAEKIRAGGADYVLTVKGNQESLHAAVDAAFAAHAEREFAAPVRVHQTRQTDHGRDETRTYYTAPAPADLVARGEWPDLRSIGMVIRRRVVGEAETTEVRYYISSRPPAVRAFARAVRRHWGIENRLHWVLDVNFAEDKSRVRRDHGPENFAMLRRFAASVLQNDTALKESINGKRLMAGWNEDILLTILAGFSGN